MPSSGQRGYDDATVIRYLLGSTSAEETERLDELSIADDEFASRLRATENDLVDSYVRRELEGALLERFEAVYLRSPERRRKVAFAESLHAVVNRPLEAAVEPVACIPAARTAWRSRRVWGLATAALLLLAAAYLLRDYRLRQEIAGLQPRTATGHPTQAAEKQPTGKDASVGTAANRPSAGGLAAFVLLPQSRGITAVPALELLPDANAVEFQLILETDDFPRYEARLRDNAANRITWRGEALRSHTSKGGRAVTVALPRNLFQPRNYSLELTGSGRAGARELIGAYVFRIAHE